jgi:hypothetical protein
MSPSSVPRSAAVLRPSASDIRQLSTMMTASLSAAETEGRVPAGLLADVVRAVLDESPQAAHANRGSTPSGALLPRRRPDAPESWHAILKTSPLGPAG